MGGESTMGRIVAIGGGEIGRPGYPLETLEIDRKIIQLSGKDVPELCFLPTATNDSEIYIRAIKKLYGTRLNCNVRNILLTKVQYTTEELSDIVMNSDIIYVGGGNTSLMLELWRHAGLTEVLIDAFRVGKILSGLSAGAMCWFDYGVSDSQTHNNSDDELSLLECLGLSGGILCPHYDQGNDRKRRLRRVLREKSDIGIGIDNCAALVLIGDSFEVACSKEGAYVHKAYWQDGEFRETRFENGYEGRTHELLTR
jgi:dipeptidase E